MILKTKSGAIQSSSLMNEVYSACDISCRSCHLP